METTIYPSKRPLSEVLVVIAEMLLLFKRGIDLVVVIVNLVVKLSHFCNFTVITNYKIYNLL